MGKLIESMDAANEIFLDQYNPTGKQVINTLMDLEKSVNNEDLETLRIAMQANGGMHENYTREKIIPDFTKEDLKEFFVKLENPSPNSLSLDVVTELLFNNEVLPKLPASRGLYPAEVNQEVMPGDANINKIKEDKLGKNKYTKVFFGPEGDIMTSSFATIYKKELDRMRKAIGKASVNFTAVERANKNVLFHLFSRYMLYLGEDNTKLTEKFPYDDSDSMLIKAYKAEDVPIFFNASFGSSYEDSFAVKNLMGAELSIETDECRSLLDIMSDLGNIQPMEDMIPFEPAKRKNVPDVPVVFQDIIYRSGAGFPNGQGIGVTYYSENKKIRDKEGAVILGWRNVLGYKGQNIMTPISKTVLSKSFISKNEANLKENQSLAFNILVMGHEECHFVGDQLEEEELRGNLGKLYDIMNEGKAETGSIYFLRHIVKKEFPGMSLDETLEFTQNTYLAGMIRHIRFGKDSSYGRSAMIRLNQFVTEGAVTITDDLKLEVDLEKMMEVNADAYKTHLEIMNTGNYKLAKAYFDKFDIKKDSGLDKQLVAIEKKLKRADIPRDITINYQV